MIAIDLDGTLLSPEGKVSARSRAAVRRVLDAGLLVCFATGRNWTESRMVLEAVAHYPTAVFAGGALIVDTEKKIVLHRMNMERSLAGELCGFIESAGFPALALQDVTIAGVDYLVTAGVGLDPVTKAWMATMNTKMRPIADLPTHTHEHTVRVSTAGPSGTVRELHTKLLATFGERVLCHRMEIPGPSIDVMEMFDPAVNKWQGILLVAERHGVAPHQIIAIGDDVNDVAMLKGAGLGVAMGNAKPAVQAMADRVVGTNAEEGLANFLGELVDQELVAPPPV